MAKKSSGTSADVNKIPSTGLTVVVRPEYPDLDIVFVHGFTGHPERTWSHKKGDAQSNNDEDPVKSPSRIRRIRLFSRSRREDLHTTTYWPRDLIPSSAPNARVLTYGYDTHIRHKLGPLGSKNTVYDIAWDFLVALEAERRAEPLRPVLFIVHSLGGIVVKEMLRRSSICRKGQTHLRGVFESTIGIMFFGTPHGGADPRGVLQRVAEKAIKAAGFSVNEQIVNTLLPSAERLRELRDEFGPMAQEQDWVLHSFQEQVGVALLSGLKVVEDTSSYLNLPDIEITEHIGRNHMNMCRFMGYNDVEYKKVVSALDRITKSVSRQSRKGKRRALEQKEKEMLLKSLSFHEIDVRQRTIKKAHIKTCRWLLQKPKYVEWLDAARIAEHHGFLWIRGNPGTGKSTLMKYAFTNALETMDRLVISFFFNARGGDLEKSTIGTYRSLLLQLLENIPELVCVFDSLNLVKSNITTSYEWSIESLKDLLSQAIQSLGKSAVVCFIDALDECEDGQVRDMIHFFQDLGELSVSAGISFQVCFSSRHYPHITISKGLELILEEEEQHTQDIVNYLESELQIGHSAIAIQVRMELLNKASGVFMWVVLVVQILNDSYERGRMDELQRRLEEIPADLHELYRQILTRDLHRQDELVLCMQWVLLAKQPLRPVELYLALRSGTEPDRLSAWNPKEISTHDIERFIIDSSRGLATCTKSSYNSRVQFIHESVKDFLNDQNGIGKIWPYLETNLQGQGHEQLKRVCLNYMNNYLYSYEPGAYMVSSSEGPQVSASNRFPFLTYAVRYVLYHADMAADSGIDQSNFVNTFLLEDWINLSNSLASASNGRFTQKASFLYILAANNRPALIKNHLAKTSCLEEEDETYAFPLLAAIITGSQQVVQLFLDSLTSSQHGHQAHGPKFHLDERRKAALKVHLSSVLTKRCNTALLSHLAVYDDDAIFSAVLGSPGALLDHKDEDGRTPLHYAAYYDSISVLKVLLTYTMSGYDSIIELLLQTGIVDINMKSEQGVNALHLAIQYGHVAVVELLLNTGKVEVNMKDRQGLTPIALAIACRREAIFNLLIHTDAINLDTIDKGAFLLLSTHKPAYRNKEWNDETFSIIKLLLETGKLDINSRDKNGRTLLSVANRRNHRELAHLLRFYTTFSTQGDSSAYFVPTTSQLS
ncbi:hypothetical protein K505DRAFT_97232 [Melanomma pulvis-pyrius CBS 109.77]|uniref:Nephrocystin 3-like N-terminal domain-containing protein n=1 Tax=Melanomma pulvis-pyrius CBS 109.77 TaxID=1314802 RepID=A0A6A6WZ36_9PLEO|nr:hypothetical protein K505DRAFT_97232 [Melanomma pulvis-pyrius CBS 109.77]